MSPVLVLINTSPAGDALKTPALDPAGKVGEPIAASWQYGPAYENCALGASEIVTTALVVVGQAPLPANETVYLPGKLATKLICPVVVLTNTSPAGAALKVPPDGLLITGVGFAAVLQKVPEGYWNCGLGILITLTVTEVRLLKHVPVV
jgi:hypothetical protein